MDVVHLFVLEARWAASDAPGSDKVFRRPESISAVRLTCAALWTRPTVRSHSPLVPVSSNGRPPENAHRPAPPASVAKLRTAVLMAQVPTLAGHPSSRKKRIKVDQDRVKSSKTLDRVPEGRRFRQGL